MSVRKLTTISIIVAMAAAVHFIEGLLPPLLPTLPGAKLGLANVFTLFTLRVYKPGDALVVLALRCLIGSLLMGGSVTGLMYSLSGGLVSWAIMAACNRFFSERLSMAGISMAGSAAHNTAQVALASLLLGSVYVFYYLIWLLLVSIPVGIFTGYTCTLCIKALGVQHAGA